MLHGVIGSHDCPINREIKPSGWLMVFLWKRREPVKKKQREYWKSKKELGIQSHGSIGEKITDTSNLRIRGGEFRDTAEWRPKGEH